MLYININVILPDHYCFPLPVLVTGKLENCILMKSCLLIHLGGNSPGVTGKITGCLPPPITRLNSHWQTFPKSVDTSRYRVIFFNWDPPKNHKYGKKLKYLNWDPPKNHKYGKKLKYPNWDPPKMYCTLTFFHT